MITIPHLFVLKCVPVALFLLHFSGGRIMLNPVVIPTTEEVSNGYLHYAEFLNG